MHKEINGNRRRKKINRNTLISIIIVQYILRTDVLR